MINILGTKPDTILNGRKKFSIDYVDKKDLKNTRFLNIGCGFGWFELNILNYDIDGVIGIEITEEDLSTAKENVINKKVHFEISSAIDLPLDDNSFDTVVSWEVIEHIPKNKEMEMLREVNRVLKDNGILYLSTPYKSFFSTFLDPAWWLIGHKHYSKNSISMLAERSNFVINKMEVKGGWYEILSWWNLYIAKWVFRREPFLEHAMTSKVNKEWSQDKGFTNIFLKCTKI